MRPDPARGVPRAKKALGQHFLSDPGILQKIVAGAGVAAGDRVLEIGPGPGGLTRALLAAGARVWALEADPRMVEHLAAQALPHLTVRLADALEADYPALAAEAGGPLTLVANLPYNISGPLLARLFRQREAFRSLTVMLQREVAERVLADPGGKVRGGLSVLADCFYHRALVLRVAPGAFRPPPKVESRVIRLDVRTEPLAPLDDEDTLWRLVRAGFGQRRKMLRNALRDALVDLEGALAAAGLTGEERPEAVATPQWIALANAAARDARAPRGTGELDRMTGWSG